MGRKIQRNTARPCHEDEIEIALALYFLNCGSMRPYFPPVENGVTCFLVETNYGPVFVDTGLGTQDYLNPGRGMNFFLKMMRSKCNVNETAFYQAQRLGYKREDVNTSSKLIFTLIMPADYQIFLMHKSMCISQNTTTSSHIRAGNMFKTIGSTIPSGCCTN